MHSEISRQALVAGTNLKLQGLSRVKIDLEQGELQLPGQPAVFHVGLKVQVSERTRQKGCIVGIPAAG